MPSVCKNLDKAPAAEMETPYKACISAIEKKLRNLEKRKGKLDAYREKLTKGEKLDKDQKEAVDKYETVIASMEFAKELQKQFQMMSDEADKLAEKQSKKQAKREKQERQQQEVERLSDVLRLQCLLDSLGTDEVRADLQSGKYTSLTLTEQNLTQLDEFFQLIAPTIDGSETSFSAQLVSSSEHLICYLDRTDKAVVSTTYKELHELIDLVAQSGFFDVSLSPAAAAAAVGEAEAELPEPAAEEELATEPETVAAAPQDEAPEIVPLAAEQTLETAQTEMEMPTASAIDAMSKSEVGEFEMVSVSESGSMMQPGSLAGMTWYQQSAAPPAAPPTIQARQQRPLQEIVSSLQGNYNFLQDSEIEVAESFDRMNFSAVQDPAAAYASYLPGPQGVPQTVADLHHYSSGAAAVVTAAPPTTYPNGSYIAAHHHQVAIQQEPSYVVVGHDPADLQYAAYTAAATQAGFMPPGVMTLPAAAAADVSVMQQQMQQQQQPKTTLQSAAHESSAKVGAGDTPENLGSAVPSQQQQQHQQQQQQHHQTQQSHHQQSGGVGQGQHHMPTEQQHQGFDGGHGYGAGHGGYSAGGPQGGGYGGRGGRGNPSYGAGAGYSGAARAPNRGGPYGGQMSSGGRGGGGGAGYRGGKSR